MTSPQACFLAAVGSAVFGLQFNREIVGDIAKAYEVASSHSLGALFFSELSKYFPKDELYSVIPQAKQDMYTTLYCERRQSFAYDKLCAEFSRQGVRFIPLKGIVLKWLYPSPELRSMEDIDILIHREDFDKAFSAACAVGFVPKKGNANDIGIKQTFTMGIVHIDTAISVQGKYLEKCEYVQNMFEHSVPVAGTQYRQTQEAEIIYVIHHAAKHMHWEGCGVRQILDMAILVNEYRSTCNWEEVKRELDSSRLTKFFCAMLGLIRKWFNVSSPSPLFEAVDVIDEVERYALDYGTFGMEKKNLVAGTMLRTNAKKKKIGAIEHFFREYVFLPSNKMAALYPSFEKHRWAIGFYWIHRLFARLIRRDKRKLIAKTLAGIPQAKTISEDESRILENLGLM
ncbi:MAG: nucleotidyltransferase family protein [Clostridia bacterium]|nr:nucleotidyltransferase family protein [Clostridia bacterium]